MVEGLLALVLEDVVKWMPGTVLGRLAAGDAASAFGEVGAQISYGAAALLTLIYAVAFTSVSVALLTRRDVT